MIKTKEDIIETIEYAIKDIKDPKMMTVDLKKQYDWRTDYDWTDLNDHPVELPDGWVKV